jgi:activator of 2-hydroxyglutaryl-CoA dehydratase
MEIVNPPEPQIVGALGAALIANAELRKTADQTLNL